MKLEVLVQSIRREEREEGRIEGLISQIFRKTIKGKAPEEIAEDLEVELSEVKRIYDVVVKYLPDYEPEKILEELQGKCKQVSGADPAGCHNEK